MLKKKSQCDVCGKEYKNLSTHKRLVHNSNVSTSNEVKEIISEDENIVSPSVQIKKIDTSKDHWVGNHTMSGEPVPFS